MIGTTQIGDKPRFSRSCCCRHTLSRLFGPFLALYLCLEPFEVVKVSMICFCHFVRSQIREALKWGEGKTLWVVLTALQDESIHEHRAVSRLHTVLPDKAAPLPKGLFRFSVAICQSQGAWSTPTLAKWEALSPSRQMALRRPPKLWTLRL